MVLCEPQEMQKAEPTAIEAKADQNEAQASGEGWNRAGSWVLGGAKEGTCHRLPGVDVL